MLFENLYDHFVPGSAAQPGARALGLHTIAVEQFGRDGPQRDASSFVLGELETQRYFSWPFERQRAFLSRQLQDLPQQRGDRLSMSLHIMLEECLRLYYTHPAAQAALQYQVPGLRGYPDYARCASG